MTLGDTPDQPAPPDLRPLGVGETLDAAFRMLRQNFGTYLKVAVLFLTVPALLLGAYMLSQLVMVCEGFIFVNDPDSYGIFAGALGLLLRLSEILCFGVLVHLSTRLYMNGTETSGSIISASRPRLASFFGMSVLLVLYMAAVLIGSLMTTFFLGPVAGFVIVAVVLAWLTYYSLSAPAFWYEQATAGAAIGRSAALVRNRFWKVFWALFVGFAIIGVFTFGLSALAVVAALNTETPLTYVSLTVGLEYVGNLISIVATAPIVTVVYFDGRVRNEGLDMALKLDQSDENEPPPHHW
jgi:hypothetical protein